MHIFLSSVNFIICIAIKLFKMPIQCLMFGFLILLNQKLLNLNYNFTSGGKLHFFTKAIKILNYSQGGGGVKALFFQGGMSLKLASSFEVQIKTFLTIENTNSQKFR